MYAVSRILYHIPRAGSELRETSSTALYALFPIAKQRSQTSYFRFRDIRAGVGDAGAGFGGVYLMRQFHRVGQEPVRFGVLEAQEFAVPAEIQAQCFAVSPESAVRVLVDFDWGVTSPRPSACRRRAARFASAWRRPAASIRALGIDHTSRARWRGLSFRHIAPPRQARNRAVCPLRL